MAAQVEIVVCESNIVQIAHIESGEADLRLIYAPPRRRTSTCDEQDVEAVQHSGARSLLIRGEFTLDRIGPRPARV